MHVWPFRELLVWIFLATLYYALGVNLGIDGMTRFLDFMFADYIELWHTHFAHRVPSWTNPFVLILIALFLWRFRAYGVIALTRQFAAIIAAIFIVRLVMFTLDLYPVPMSFSYIILGVGSFIWYIASTFWVDQTMRGKLQEFIQRIRTE